MKIEELDLQETNSTYSAIFWDERSASWVNYLHRGKYRYFYPDQVNAVLDCLSDKEYRLYRHDTTRER